MEVAGLSAESMFREVRNDVIRRTNGAQVPWEASSLVGAPFHFNPRQGAATAEASPNPPVAKPAASGTRSGEVVFWQSILGSTNRAVFEEYLHQYPDGQFAGLARIESEKGLLPLLPVTPDVDRPATFQARFSGPCRAMCESFWTWGSWFRLLSGRLEDR